MKHTEIVYSNKEGLKKIIVNHRKQFLPEMWAELEIEGTLEETIRQAVDRIFGEMKAETKNQMQNNNLTNQMAMSIAWEIARPMWIMLESEENQEPSEEDNLLNQNYPNPFNPSTKINYSIANEGFVSIKVFDNLGREVATLVNESKTAGFYTADFNGLNLNSGVYYYRLESGGSTKVMKMSLIK